MATTVKTTKEIRTAVDYLMELPRTNKFKRALDVALLQDLPLEISIARPFGGFSGKINGKPARFKVCIKNTRTGKYRLFGRMGISNRPASQVLVFRGIHFGAGEVGREDFEKRAREYAIEKNLVWTEDELKAAPFSYTGSHTCEEVRHFCWGDFAKGVSDICKEDFAHTEPCGKCGGSGFIQAFAHVDNGVCWGCMGSGWHLHLGEAALKAGVK